MSRTGKKLGWGLLKATALAVAFGIAVWVGWRYIGQVLNPDVSKTEAQVATGTALVLWGWSMLVAEQRTRARLTGQTVAGPRAGLASAITGSMHMGSMGAWSFQTGWRVVAAFIGLLAPLIAAGLVVVMAGYAPIAISQPWPWLVVPLGVLTAWACARKVGAVMGVGLTPRMLTRQVAGWPLGAAGGAAAFFATGTAPLTAATIGTTAGLAASSSATAWAAATQAKRKRLIEGPVSAALGIGQRSLQDHANWKVNKGATQIDVFAPLPGDVVKGLPALEERVATHLPTHEVRQAGLDGITLVTLGQETAAIRNMLVDTEGLVTAIVEGPEPEGERVELVPGYDDLKGRRGLLAGRTKVTGVAEVQEGFAVLTEGRPVHQTANITLSATMTTGQLGVLQARLRDLGWALTSLDLGAHRATVDSLPPWETALRARIASALRVDPWTLGMTATWVDDEGVRLDEVALTGLPATLGTAEKARPVLRDLVTAVIPGGNEGWKVDYDSQDGSVVLTHAQPPTLPAVSRFTDLPLEDLPWWKLPLGVGPDGDVAGINLKLGPHSLVVGPTGSGKSIAARTLLAGALLAGHRVLILDAVKRAVDFVGLRPFATAFATDHDAVRIALERVYAEGRRRMEIIEAEATRAADAGEDVPESWADLSKAVREREDIAPMLVLLDEAAGHMMAGKVPKSLPADDPKRQAAEKRLLNAESIQQTVTLATAELRAAGVFIVLATQRPDANVIGGLLRSNLTSRVQQSKPGEPPSREALAMVFDPEELEPAREAIRVLGRDRNPGLAVMASEGGSVTGLRVAYAEGRTLPKLLEERGVQRVADPWDLRDPSEVEEEQFGPPADWDAAPAEPDVEDLGELDLDLDLDDLEGDEVTEKPSATTESDPDSDAILSGIHLT